MDILSVMLVGLAAGFLGGLLGIGGGVLLVPAFIFILRDRTPTIHVAVGTSMAVIIAISVAGTIEHALSGRVNWAIVPYVAVFAIIGSFLGAHVSGLIGRLALRRLFALLLVVVAAKMFFSKPPEVHGRAAASQASEQPAGPASATEKTPIVERQAGLPDPGLR